MLDEAALEHNLTTMAALVRPPRHVLAPHGKTTMAPQLFARQLALGAWGITAANVSQLRVYRAFGVRRVQLANELVDPAGLRWLAGELDRDPDFEFSCWVDSVAGVELMTARSGGRARSTCWSNSARPAAGPAPATWRPPPAVADAVAAAGAAAGRAGGYEGALAHGTEDGPRAGQRLLAAARADRDRARRRRIRRRAR